MIPSSHPKRARRALLFVSVLGVGVSGVVAAACAPAPPQPPPPPSVYDAACAGTLIASTPGSVANGAVTEASGIVASRRNPGVWWVHDDSGHPAQVFAIGDDGRDLGTFTLSGAANVDWEDIAVGPGPAAGTDYLYVADIGNNNNPKRNAVDVYRVPEPAVSSTVSSGAVNLGGVTKLTFSYPSGATPDAEALLVDPTTGELFVVTKVTSGTAQVYRADVGTGTFVPVATLPIAWVTGGDVTRTGDYVALRTYTDVLVYPRPSGGSVVDAFAQTPCHGAVPATLAQYEAIGFTPDGRGYVTTSEGAHPPLYRFDAP